MRGGGRRGTEGERGARAVVARRRTSASCRPARFEWTGDGDGVRALAMTGYGVGGSGWLGVLHVGQQAPSSSRRARVECGSSSARLVDAVVGPT